jgi:thiol-disulfide isomerase/thioredoxin
VSRPLAVLLLVAAVISAGAGQGLRPVDETSYLRLLTAQRGNLLIVDFWATWCASCREEMPLLVQLAEKHRSRGLRLVTVSCDDPEQEGEALKFLDEHKAPEPRYLKKASDDEKFINSIDRKWSGALPALFLYGKDGRLVRSFFGETDMAELEKTIREMR